MQKTEVALFQMTTAARSHPPHKAILIGPTSLHIVGHAGAFTGTDLMGVAFFLTLEKSFHRGSKMKELRHLCGGEGN